MGEGGKKDTVGFSEVARDVTERRKVEHRILAQRDLAIALGAVRDLTRGLRLCLDAAVEMTEMDSGGIYLLEAASGDFVLAAHKGLASPFVRAASRYGADSEPARIMKSDTPLFVSEITPETPMAAELDAEGIATFHSVPLKHNGRLLGCINLGSHRGGAESRGDRTALEAVSAQIGGVIARLEAEKALRRTEEHLRSLMETATRYAVYGLRIDPALPQGLRVVFVSPSIRNLLGVADPMDFTQWFSNLAAEDRERILAANQSSFNTRRFDEVMRVILPGSGEIRWIHAVSTAVREETGAPRFVNGLMIDITEQKRVEKALSERERELEAESGKLQEINTALRVLLKKREEDRVELEEKVLANVNEMIQPHLKRAKSFLSDPKARTHLHIAEENLKEITSPFGRKLTSRLFRLTPAEIQVAQWVRRGYSSKEIAAHMNISPKTVEVHRLNIRKKLGIAGKRVNLRTCLLNLE